MTTPTPTPDMTIFLESGPTDRHQWTLWIDGEPVRFKRKLDLYTATDIATAYLSGITGIEVTWYGPIRPDFSRYYIATRKDMT